MVGGRWYVVFALQKNIKKIGYRSTEVIALFRVDR
jgi:hypothetical protein